MNQKMKNVLSQCRHAKVDYQCSVEGSVDGRNNLSIPSFDVNHLIDKCLRINYKMVAAMAIGKDV
jgi:hypothetical protein